MNTIYDTAFRQATNSGLLPSSIKILISLLTYIIDLYNGRISHAESILWLLYCNTFLSFPLQTMAWTLFMLSVYHTRYGHAYKSKFSEVAIILNAIDKIIQYYATCYLAPHSIAFVTLMTSMFAAWLPREAIMMVIRAFIVLALALVPLGQARLFRKYKAIVSFISFLITRAYLYKVGGTILDSDATAFITVFDGQMVCILDVIVLPDGRFISTVAYKIDPPFKNDTRMTAQYTLSPLSISVCTRILGL